MAHAYPGNFQRPTPLKEFLLTNDWSNAKAAKHFGGFTVSAIQKMVVNEERDIGVWGEKLVETVTQKVLSSFTEGRHTNWPLPHEIIFVKTLTPLPKLGPNPTAKKRGPRSVDSE